MLVDKSSAQIGQRGFVRMLSGRGAILAVLIVSALAAANSDAQEQGVPFQMQDVGDQVVNGVQIKGGRIPVWTDANGRPAGRPTQSAPTNRADQDELDELARIGRPDAPVRAQVAQPAVSGSLGRAPIPTGPQYDVIGSTTASANATRTPSSTPAAVIHRRARTEDEELVDLQHAVTQAESDLRMKEKQIEERKKDDSRRAEEARVVAEREAARQHLVFQAQAGQMLSEAISAYVGQNGWENVEWNVGPDFRVKYTYSERPDANQGMKEVLLKILKPYGLSAELHRPNSVVEIFNASDVAARN